jgi:hypothetical protein
METCPVEQAGARRGREQNGHYIRSNTADCSSATRLADRQEPQRAGKDGASLRHRNVHGRQSIDWLRSGIEPPAIAHSGLPEELVADRMHCAVRHNEQANR